MKIKRAQGCLLGQLSGDALGSLVEFQTPNLIQKQYPNGVYELADGGTWNTIAGQPTDDSEMALLLARLLIQEKNYHAEKALSCYRYWLDSKPFDCGMTIANSLQGCPNPNSQANGALMRISPLGIFGSNYPLSQVSIWAMQDAKLTHPNIICQQVNALFVMAIAQVLNTGDTPHKLYQKIKKWAKEMAVNATIINTIALAENSPPQDYIHQQGWVLTAFHNALWQLLNAPNLEKGLIDTVMQGGDTDTNAAICGALLGAVYGIDAIPQQWKNCILNCRPQAGKENVYRPRPKCFWPVDALQLAEHLIEKI